MCSLCEQSEPVTSPPSDIFHFNAALLVVTGNAGYDYKDMLLYIDKIEPVKFGINSPISTCFHKSSTCVMGWPGVLGASPANPLAGRSSCTCRRLELDSVF